MGELLSETHTAPPIAVWVPDLSDLIRTSDYPVVCCIETDRTLFVFVRHASTKRPPPDRIMVYMDTDPQLENWSLTGAVGRKDGLHQGVFDRPAPEVDSLDVILTINGEIYSDTTVTRGFTI